MKKTDEDVRRDIETLEKLIEEVHSENNKDLERLRKETPKPAARVIRIDLSREYSASPATNLVVGFLVNLILFLLLLDGLGLAEAEGVAVAEEQIPRRNLPPVVKAQSGGEARRRTRHRLHLAVGIVTPGDGAALGQVEGAAQILELGQGQFGGMGQAKENGPEGEDRQPLKGTVPGGEEH